jgi:putative flippase GtrA
VNLPCGPASQFLRFALVGTAGFVVDSAVLYLAMGTLHANHYSGRLLSFLTAATFTWAMNRRYTFADEFEPAARVVCPCNHSGRSNYGVYAAGGFHIIADRPVIGVAAGSLVGLAINFYLSRRMVFNKHSS